LNSRGCVPEESKIRRATPSALSTDKRAVFLRAMGGRTPAPARLGVSFYPRDKERPTPLGSLYLCYSPSSPIRLVARSAFELPALAGVATELSESRSRPAVRTLCAWTCRPRRDGGSDEQASAKAADGVDGIPLCRPSNGPFGARSSVCSAPHVSAQEKVHSSTETLMLQLTRSTRQDRVSRRH
jgi:hypothetical protein